MDAKPVNAWILDPIASAVTFVADEAKTGGLLQRSLAFIENGQPLLALAAQRLQGARNRSVVAGIKKLLCDAPIQAQWAAEIRENDYSLLNAHLLVAIWGALETCVEDTVVAILDRTPDGLKVLVDVGVKVPELGGSSPDDYELRKLFRKLEDVVRVKYDVVATQENVLATFGLSGACPSHNETLRKANSLRNALVHRGGVIDEKAIEQSPALRNQLGQKCVITRELYMQCHEAVGAVLVALMGSITNSKYMVSK